MDDFLEILIYAIIIILGAIASAVQAKKKARPGTGTATPKRTVPGKGAMPPFFGDQPFGNAEDIFTVPEQKADKPVYESINDSVEEGPSLEAGYDESFNPKSIEEGPSVEEAGFDAEKRPQYVSVEDHIKYLATRSFTDAGSTIDSTIYTEGESSFSHGENEIETDVITAGEIVSEEDAADALRKSAAAMERIDWNKAIIYSEILKRKEF